MMKKVIIFILCVLLCIGYAACSLPALALSDADTAETTEGVPTDEEPTDTEEYEDYSESFLNANIYTFAVGVAALLICTAVFVIIKLRKKAAEK